MAIRKKIILLLLVIILSIMGVIYLYMYNKNHLSYGPGAKPMITIYYDEAKDDTSFYAIAAKDYEELNIKKGQQIVIMQSEFDSHSFKFEKNTFLTIICDKIIKDEDTIYVIALGGAIHEEKN